MGRQAKLKQQRRNLKVARPQAEAVPQTQMEQPATAYQMSPETASLFAQLNQADFELEWEMFEINLPNQPKRPIRFHAGTVPCTPKLFFHELDLAWVREACLEYWQMHDFNWTTSRVPDAPTLVDRIPLCSEDLPGDMATALSLQAFAQHYKDGSIPEETEVRHFCVVICGLGKAMQMLQKKCRNFTPEELYEAALQITHCTTGAVVIRTAEQN